MLSEAWHEKHCKYFIATIRETNRGCWHILKTPSLKIGARSDIPPRSPRAGISSVSPPKYPTSVPPRQLGRTGFHSSAGPDKERGQQVFLTLRIICSWRGDVIGVIQYEGKWEQVLGKREHWKKVLVSKRRKKKERNHTDKFNRAMMLRCSGFRSPGWLNSHFMPDRITGDSKIGCEVDKVYWINVPFCLRHLEWSVRREKCFRNAFPLPKWKAMTIRSFSRWMESSFEHNPSKCAQFRIKTTICFVDESTESQLIFLYTPKRKKNPSFKPPKSGGLISLVSLRTWHVSCAQCELTSVDNTLLTPFYTSHWKSNKRCSIKAAPACLQLLHIWKLLCSRLCFVHPYAFHICTERQRGPTTEPRHQINYCRWKCQSSFDYSGPD